MITMIPIGAWCRVAHQVKLYCKEKAGLSSASLPFDWTITSFAALKTVLDPTFDPASILPIDRSVVSFAGSAQCDQTNIIFHHALPPNFIQQVGSFSVGDSIPSDVSSGPKFNDVRGRFVHTFNHLRTIAHQSVTPIFVRWIRKGHPDHQFPFAFEGETPETLYALLDNFIGHKPFFLVVVTSHELDPLDVKAVPQIESVTVNPAILTCRLDERRGWNGDGTNDFRGDEASWRALFDLVFQHWTLGQYQKFADA